MKRIAAAMASLLLCGAGNYNAALGMGDKTCKEWTAARNGAGAEAAAQWLLGFISGLNIHTPDMIIMDEEGRGMLVPLDQYCAKRPATSVETAAFALIVVEYKDRIALLKRTRDLMDKK